MNDPLAHLYAETGAGVPDEELELPTRSTSIDALNAVDAEAEEISDADVEELALLVFPRVNDGTFTNEDAVELGLGSLIDGDDLALNRVGIRVFRSIIEKRLGAHAFAHIEEIDAGDFIVFRIPNGRGETSLTLRKADQ